MSNSKLAIVFCVAIMFAMLASVSHSADPFGLQTPTPVVSTPTPAQTPDPARQKLLDLINAIQQAAGEIALANCMTDCLHTCLQELKETLENIPASNESPFK